MSLYSEHDITVRQKEIELLLGSFCKKVCEIPQWETIMLEIMEDLQDIHEDYFMKGNTLEWAASIAYAFCELNDWFEGMLSIAAPPTQKDIKKHFNINLTVVRKKAMQIVDDIDSYDNEDDYDTLPEDFDLAETQEMVDMINLMGQALGMDVEKVFQDFLPPVIPDEILDLADSEVERHQPSIKKTLNTLKKSKKLQNNTDGDSSEEIYALQEGCEQLLEFAVCSLHKPVQEWSKKDVTYLLEVSIPNDFFLPLNEIKDFLFVFKLFLNVLSEQGELRLNNNDIERVFEKSAPLFEKRMIDPKFQSNFKLIQLSNEHELYEKELFNRFQKLMKKQPNQELVDSFPSKEPGRKNKTKNKNPQKDAPKPIPTSAKASLNKVLTLRISLADSIPEVFRIIDIPAYTDFLTFHMVLQQLMDWEDAHLYIYFANHKGMVYEIMEPEEYKRRSDRIFSDDPLQGPPLLANQYRLADFLTRKGSKIHYIYDFGDNWEILIERISHRELDTTTQYAQCTEGEMAGPPEDTGGIMMYNEYMTGLNQEESDDMDFDEIYPDDFDPYSFSPETLNKQLKKIHIQKF